MDEKNTSPAIARLRYLCTAHVMVRAPIHSRLDYCNGLLSGLPAGQIVRLQGVLRSAARLVLSLPSRAPVSAAMHDTLRWLDFPQRNLLVYKCLYAMAYKERVLCCPLYLVDHTSVPLRTSNVSYRHRSLLPWALGRSARRALPRGKLFLLVYVTHHWHRTCRRAPSIGH